MNNTQLPLSNLSTSAVEFLEDGRCFAYDESVGKPREIIVSYEVNVIPPVPTVFKNAVGLPSAIAEDLDLDESPTRFVKAGQMFCRFFSIR